MRAAQDDGVDARAPQRLGQLLEPRAQPLVVQVALLDEVGQSRTGLGQDVDAGRVLAHEPRVARRGQRARGCHHGHLPVPREGGRGLHRGLQADDGDRQGLPELLEGRSGRGVACGNEHPGPQPLHVGAHHQRARTHLMEGTIPVGTVGGVRDVEKVFGGKGAPYLARDAQAAHAGIEHADGPPRAHAGTSG